jgi:hypothetical protein
LEIQEDVARPRARVEVEVVLELPALQTVLALLDIRIP